MSTHTPVIVTAWLAAACFAVALGVLLLVLREKAADALHDFQTWRTTRGLLRARAAAVTAGPGEGWARTAQLDQRP